MSSIPNCPSLALIRRLSTSQLLKLQFKVQSSPLCRSLVFAREQLAEDAGISLLQIICMLPFWLMNISSLEIL